MEVLSKIKKLGSNKNVKNSIIYTFFLFFNNGLSFILLLILASYLSPNDYGKLSLFTTFVSLLQIVICLSSTSYLTVAFFQKLKIEIQRLITTIILISLIILAILLVITILDKSDVEKIVGFQNLFVILGIFICFFQVFNNINLDLWRLEEKPLAYGFYNFTYALINFVLTLWFVISLKLGWVSRPYSWFIVSCLFFIISGIYLLKRGYVKWIKPTFSIIKETLIYAIPLIPHSISYWLKQGADRYVINYYYNSEYVGFFSFAMNLASIIVMVGAAFNSSNSVYIYKNLKEGYNTVKITLIKQEKIMIAIFSCIGVLTIISAVSLIPFFFPKYVSSIPYIIPLMIGAVFQCIYLLYVNYMFFYKKTLILMYISLITAVLQILLSILLTKYSTLYTAYISMLTSILTAASVCVYSNNLVKKHDSCNAN